MLRHKQEQNDNKQRQSAELQKLRLEGLFSVQQDCKVREQEQRQCEFRYNTGNRIQGKHPLWLVRIDHDSQFDQAVQHQKRNTKPPHDLQMPVGKRPSVADVIRRISIVYADLILPAYNSISSVMIKCFFPSASFAPVFLSVSSASPSSLSSSFFISP